jgi:hypothetical protein
MIDPQKPKAVKGDVGTQERMQDKQLGQRILDASPNLAEPFLAYNKISGELISHVGDAYIVLGKDKPEGITSGYFGESNCSTIDLVVGRCGVVGQQIAEEFPDKAANNNFYLDSARIYISQRTDVDDNLGLTDFFEKVGVHEGPAKNRSAIAIKADGVRIVAREGIKLVTMTDETNSTNNTIAGKYGIELIGGANINEENYDLQSLIKGDNMVEAMSKILEHFAQLDTQFAKVDKMLTQIMTAFTAHAHVSGVPVTGPPIDPNSIVQSVLTFTDIMMQVGELNLRQFNHGQYKMDFLVSGSPTYICSLQNKTT